MKPWIDGIRKQLWHFRNGGWEAANKQRRNNRSQVNPYGGAPDNVTARVSGRGKHKTVSFEGMGMLPNEPRRQGLTAAVILDDFSLGAFGFEWNQIVLARDAWREQLRQNKPDLLFVESAWAGNSGQWQYQLTGESGLKEEFRHVVEECQALHIPTVFWNKEDPPHYADFLEAAKLFDYVFTSDSDRIADYCRDLGHENVGVLQFAAQPKLHNPVRPRFGWHDRDVAFAGMFFAHKYPERRQQLELLLDASASAVAGRPGGLEIFSRHGGESKNYQFPQRYQPHVVGSLPYAQMLTAYKAYKLFLNVNSVVTSPSMCARRIFEITAAGTSVVSTPSKALATVWEPNEQFVVGAREQAEEVISSILRNPELSDRQLHLAQRKIWGGHTYAHRVEQIVEAVLPRRGGDAEDRHVSVIVSSMRPHQLESIFATAGSFVGVDIELVLSTHGFDPGTSVLEHLAEKYGVKSLVHVTQPTTTSLGFSLNECVRLASGTYVTKMDDDDYYGPFYLLDLVHALMYSGADIVGKQAHYMHLAGRDATILRFPEKEHRFTTAVMGPTITGRREVFLEVPFEDLSRGEDTAFLCAARESGKSIYSSDRFNYCQYRGTAEHTWKVSDDKLLTTGDLVFFGAPHNHVSL